TFDEIRGALDACAIRIRRGQLRDAYGPSMEYFLDKGYTASDIELRLARLEDDIRALRVQVVDKPAYELASQIDEEALGNALANSITYRSQQARDRDADSLSAIARLRRGHRPSISAESGAAFVSSNLSRARAGRD